MSESRRILFQSAELCLDINRRPAPRQLVYRLCLRQPVRILLPHLLECMFQHKMQKQCRVSGASKDARAAFLCPQTIAQKICVTGSDKTHRHATPSCAVFFHTADGRHPDCAADRAQIVPSAESVSAAHGAPPVPPVSCLSMRRSTQIKTRTLCFQPDSSAPVIFLSSPADR